MSNLRDTVKEWFETGDKPTQAQFAQLFDSLYFLDETLQPNKINGLDTVLNAKADKTQLALLQPIIVSNQPTVQIPPYTWVTAVLIFSTTNASITVGTTNGGTEYSDGIEIANGKGLLQYSYVTGAAAETFYFGNLPQNAIVKIYKQ